MLVRKSYDVDGARLSEHSAMRQFGGSKPSNTLDRRSFLKRSGLGLGAGAFASQLPLGFVGKVEAAPAASSGKAEVKRTVFTHCSVGCAVDAVVQNGVWVRTVRLTSILPVLSPLASVAALAFLTKLNCEAAKPTPTPKPDRRRKPRRSMVGSALDKPRDRL